jgi:two-component system, response regulator YesN
MLRYIVRYLLTNKKTRLILLLTLGVSLCITLIGIFSYSKYREVLDTELNTPNVELLQINVDVTNRAFQESDTKAVDAAFHPLVLEFIRKGQAAGAQEPGSLDSYLKTISSHPDIRSIDIVSFRNRSVLSSLFGYIPNWEASPDSTWTSWIFDMETKPLLVKRRMQGTAAEPGKIELLTLARPIVIDGQVSGAVVVNMDYDRFFSKIYTHLSSHQYVYDLDGDLIYPKLNIPVAPQEMNKVMTEMDVRPFAYVKVEGQDYMGNQAFSNVTGWRMISLVPMEQLLKNVRMARDMMLILSFISILIGCSAMYYYNYAAFRPLKRINKLLSPLQKAASQGDLHALEPMIGKLIGDFHNKNLVAERSLPELQSKFIQDVIARSIGSQEIRTKWQQYFQDWEPGELEVLVVSIDYYWQWASEYMEEDQMLLKYAMNNVLLEALEPGWRSVSVAARKDGFVVLLQSKEQRETTLEQDAERLIQMIEEYLHMKVSVGIGITASDILQVTKSYDEAKEALSYRLYEGYGLVRDYAAIELLNDEYSPQADDSWKKEILQSLMNSDADTSVQWVRRGVEDARKRKIHPQRVYRIIDDMLEELLRVITARSLVTPPELADYTWHQVTTAKLEDIEEMLCRIVVQLAAELGKRRQSKEYHLVQSMIRFMEEKLHQNIGLQDIADHINMGISSVSNIFKEETGSTVYDYLTNLRIDKACELLIDSPLKIADIALQVGYQNENSFIRAFRKVKSITPGKFRESSKYPNGYADPPKPRHSGISEDSPQD